MLKKRFKEYFTFTKKERNGVLVLLFLLIIVVSINIYMSHKSFGEISLKDEKFANEVKAFEEALEQKEELKRENKVRRLNQKKAKIEYFKFDPNSISSKNLKRLGLSEFQIKTWINYRKSGGEFREKKDLLKIYGIEKEDYKLLEPYIEISTKEIVAKENKREENISFDLIEVNAAKPEELVKLPGIGESYAKKIISYRSLLGGFQNKKQLLEVYGMDSIRFRKIDSLIYIDTSMVQRLNINAVKFKTLLRHPYLSKYQTNAIMKYRELAGKFERIEQLLELNVFTEEEYKRVKPYLFIEESE